MPSKIEKVSPRFNVILDNGGGDVKACLLPETTASSKTPLSTPSPSASSATKQSPTSPFIATNAFAKPSPKAIAPPASLAGKSRRPNGQLVAAEIAKAPDVSGITVRRPHDRGVIS